MTIKELQRLRRQDLLQLLLTQGQEIAEIQAEQEEREQEIVQVSANNVHLQEKLDEKEALLTKLEKRLSNKDVRAKKLEEEMAVWRAEKDAKVENAGSIAAAALGLNDVFEVAKQAADQYLYNIRQRYGGPEEVNPQQPDDMGGPGI